MLLPKVSFVPAFLVVLATPRASAHPTVIPHRVTFGSLLNANDGVGGNDTLLLMDGLTRDGVVSVTDIPSFKETKRALMSHLHACIMSVDDVPTQSFQDGTIRRSFATSTTHADGPQPIKSLDEFEALSDHSSSESCQRFRSHLSAFRSMVDLATRQFAERLSAEMGASLPKPLLSTRSSNSADYEDIKQVVAGGVHLEHFHSYQKGGAVDDETTIEFHTDQGFFIAFTPGLIVSSDPSSEEPLELSDGFFVQDSNGEKFMMEFTGGDDLVFMMGDGVNQFINNNLIDDHKGLLATPHALTIHIQEDTSQARVWYGRMVLPPSDAYLPSMDSTFGEARQILVDSSATGSDVPLGIGCSSPNMKASISTSRNLDGPSVESKCPEDELFCWFRCQKLSDHGITADNTCSQRNLGLQCVNPQGHVIPGGMKHGDFFPLCTNNTHVTHPWETYPEIEQLPDTCGASLWEDFSDPEDYDHKVDLTRVNGTKTMLFWSIEGDEGAKKMRARIAFNNTFGWLAVGFADVDDYVHNGMNGANIIMSIPGGNYSAATGLDLEADPSVGTYKINPTDSSFRHWQNPIESDETKTTVANFEHTECFTDITFESDHINGQKFNFEGTDEMIWGGNHLDHFVGYHGREHRARFTVDWNTGDVLFFGEEKEVETTAKNGGTHEDDDGRDHGTDKSNDGSVKNSVLGLSTSFVFATVVHYLYGN